jgi:alkanesulfonate monooxygenase SsuD/methylene tetrahydromethanopterin reductase-like flavin-dependent oxidoreductase (luciferase family)
MWYGSSNVVGSQWAGERGLHFASNGGTERAKENIAAYRAALAGRGTGVETPHAEFPGGGAIGISRQVVVADTDEEAHRIAKPAHEHIYNNQMFLRREALRRTDMKSRPGYVDPPSKGDYDLAIADGSTIAGSPATVRAAIEAQIEALGINYLICYFMFGNMTLKDAMRSMELFATQVKANVGEPARR